MTFFKKQMKSERGQSLVEFALSLPVLLLLLTGLLDLGRAYYTYIALEEAAAEAALFLAIQTDCPNENASRPQCENPNNALYRARTSGNNEFDFSRATWNIPYDGAAQAAGFRSPFGQDDVGSPASDCTAIGCTVIVQVEYEYELLTPVIDRMAEAITGGEGIILTVQASQIIVFELGE